MHDENKNTQLLFNSVKSGAFLLNRHQALPPEFHSCDLSKYNDPNINFDLMLFINEYTSKMYLEYGYFRTRTYENNYVIKPYFQCMRKNTRYIQKYGNCTCNKGFSIDFDKKCKPNEVVSISMKLKNINDDIIDNEDISVFSCTRIPESVNNRASKV